MAPVRNARVIFTAIPGAALPVPGETTVYDESESIDLENVALHGGLLLKTLYLSIDPYQKGKMRSPDIKGHSPPYSIGETCVIEPYPKAPL